MKEIKRLIRKILPTDTKPVETKGKKRKEDGNYSRFLEPLKHDPLNAELHADFSDYCTEIGNHYLAYAEYRTAVALGLSPNKQILEDKKSSLPELLILNHNQYYRFRTLAVEVLKRAKEAGLENISILDIGGGHGQLAAFLPDAKYVLVEPDVNGISGIDLPFEDRSFEFVVACHVLEHIPPEQRHDFLNALVAKSNTGAVLLNPIYVEGSHNDARIDLYIDILNARWAKEHKECKLPKVEELQSYGQENKVRVDIEYKGTVSSSMALVFAAHYSNAAGLKGQYEKVNRFYNELLIDQLDSKDFPSFGLFYLTRK